MSGWCSGLDSVAKVENEVVLVGLVVVLMNCFDGCLENCSYERHLVSCRQLLFMRVNRMGRTHEISGFLNFVLVALGGLGGCFFLSCFSSSSKAAKMSAMPYRVDEDLFWR